MSPLAEIVELSGADLDAVAGGQPLAVAAGGLVNVALNDINIDVIDDVFVNVNLNDSIRDIANNNNVSVGAVIAALGGGGAVITRQSQ